MRVGPIVNLARLGLIGVLVAGCSSLGPGGNTPAGRPSGGAAPAITVQVAKAVSGPISQTTTYTGSVQPSNSVNVAPKISGLITKLNVDVGSHVKTGDVIAELDKGSLQASVDQAQAAVDAAQVKLDQIKAGARPEAVAVAQANVASAQAKLAAEQAGPRPETVAQSKANLEIAQAKLKAIQAGARSETVAQSKANLDSAIAKLNQLKDGPTKTQILAAQDKVEQAKDSANAVNISKDAAYRFSGPSCSAAQANADSAATAIVAAQHALDDLVAPPTADALAQAQAAVNAAQDAYALAQKPYTAQDIAQAQAAVDAAQQAYLLAQKPYTATDIAQAQAAVDAATNQAKLAATPYTDLDVKAAQATLEQAQATLSGAKAQLAQTTVVAPIDGVVSAKLLSLGSLAGPGTPIVTLMSNQEQVQFSIEEAKIGSIKEGQSVNLTTGAYPDKTFPASVTTIYPSADPKLHTFTVVVKPQDPAGLLRSGMFVNLAVVIASKTNAILVPAISVIQRGSQSVVFTVTNNVAHLTPVTTGLSDDKNVEIVKGVTAGESVVTSGQANLRDAAPVREAGAGGNAGAAGRGGAAGQGGQGGQAGQGTRPAGQGGQTGARQAGARVTPTAAH